MKQGNSVITLVMVLLALALTGYLGVYIFNTFTEPYTTTIAYSYTDRDSIEADGLLVRDERPFAQQTGILDVLCGEGERVYKGQTVALVYRDGQAQQAQSQQDELARDIELLEYSIQESGDVLSAARLDEDILQSLVALRGAVSLGDFNQLESQVISLKSGVLKRDYTYGTNLTTQDLLARLQDLNAQLSALKTRSQGATTGIYAAVPGTFSSQIDGYESIAPDALLQITPDNFKGLLQQAPGLPQQGAAGKLITSTRWYFSAIFSEADATRIDKESVTSNSGTKTITVRFTGEFSQDVIMTVEQIGTVVDGQAVVVLSSDRYLAQTTLLRRQTAELVFSTNSGVRIPKAALRMETREVAIEDSSETKEENIVGVYAIVNGRAIFKRANIITQGGDFYVVTTVNEGKYALRAGDEIVLRGTGLYDGKLMEY